MTPASTKTSTTAPPDLAAEYETVDRIAWRAGVLATVNVLALVLAVRLVLLVAVIGAVILAFLGVQSPEPLRLYALAVYAALVVLPAIWLASRH